MKIKVKGQGKRFYLWIPNFIISNKLLRRVFEKGKIELNEQLIEVIPKILHEFKIFARKNRNFILVDVISKDNEKVKITL